MYRIITLILATLVAIKLNGQTTPGGCNYFYQPCFSVSSSICQSTDDVLESVPWNWVDNQHYGELGGSGEIQIGLRFKNVNLPSNAIVKSAYLQFVGGWNSDNNGIVNINIEGEDLTQNSVTFTTTPGTLSGRTATSASVSWSCPNFNYAALAEVTKTSDLKPIIDEFISDGWTQNDPMTFMLSTAVTSTSKVLLTYDSDQGTPSAPIGTYAPNLVIEYSLPVPTCSGISGFVYNDQNDNGSFDPPGPSISEEGIADVTVNIYNDSGYLGSDITDDYGNWNSKECMY